MLDLTPATDAVARVVAAVPDSQLDAPTPCEGTSVGALLDHLDGLAQAFAAAARKTPVEAGASVDASRLGDDWRERIPARLAVLANAWRDPDAWTGMTAAGGVDLPGEVAGLVALDEVVVHGWDVARATGQELAVDAHLVEGALGFVRQAVAEHPAGSRAVRPAGAGGRRRPAAARPAGPDRTRPGVAPGGAALDRRLRPTAHAVSRPGRAGRRVALPSEDADMRRTASSRSPEPRVARRGWSAASRRPPVRPPPAAVAPVGVRHATRRPWCSRRRLRRPARSARPGRRSLLSSARSSGEHAVALRRPVPLVDVPAVRPGAPQGGRDDHQDADGQLGRPPAPPERVAGAHQAEQREACGQDA